MDIDKLTERYKNKLQPRYKELSKRVKELLGDLLRNADIAVDQIKSRPKEVDSFVKKLKHKEYDDPFEEIKDFAGVRVVTYYDDDIQQVAKLIRKEFIVSSEHSSDKLDDLDVNEFGYRSFHLVCRINNKRSQLNEWKSLADLDVEIQVRSVLQHAWDAISHKLDYKSLDQAPKELRRPLFRLSALLEIADEQFVVIRNKREKYYKGIQEKEGDVPEFLSQPINYDTLEVYTKFKYPDLPISKHWHARLLDDLNREKYQTLQDIDTVVKQAIKAVKAYKEENPDWFKSGTAYLTKSLGFVDSEFREKHAFGKRTIEAFRKFEHLVLKTSRIEQVDPGVNQ